MKAKINNAVELSSFSYSQQLPFNCTFWFIDCCRSCTDL